MKITQLKINPNKEELIMHWQQNKLDFFSVAALFLFNL